MDSAKLKENLFAVAKRAHGGRKRWGHILLPRTELRHSRGAACAAGLAGPGAGTPLGAIAPLRLQRGHAGATRRRLRWPEAGWGGESRLKWQETGWGHGDTPAARNIQGDARVTSGCPVALPAPRAALSLSSLPAAGLGGRVTRAGWPARALQLPPNPLLLRFINNAAPRRVGSARTRLQPWRGGGCHHPGRVTPSRASPARRGRALVSSPSPRTPPYPPARRVRGEPWRCWVPAVTPRVGTSPRLTTVARMATRSLQGCHGDVPALTSPSKH